jgi:hypothetical protein
MGEGDGAVTVHAPGADRYRGSARYDREIDAASAARAREEEDKRWEKRRRERYDEEQGEGSRAPGSPALGFARMLLIAALLVGLIFLARTLMAGKGGGGAPASE